MEIDLLLSLERTNGPLNAHLIMGLEKGHKASFMKFNIDVKYVKSQPRVITHINFVDRDTNPTMINASV